MKKKHSQTNEPCSVKEKFEIPTINYDQLQLETWMRVRPNGKERWSRLHDFRCQAFIWILVALHVSISLDFFPQLFHLMTIPRKNDLIYDWTSRTTFATTKKTLKICKWKAQFIVSLNNLIMLHAFLVMPLKKALAKLEQLHWCKSFSIEFISFEKQCSLYCYVTINLYTYARTLSPSIDEWKTSLSARIVHNYFRYCLFAVRNVRFQCFSHECWFSVEYNVRTTFFRMKKSAKFQFNSIKKKWPSNTGPNVNKHFSLNCNGFRRQPCFDIDNDTMFIANALNNSGAVRYNSQFATVVLSMWLQAFKHEV